MTTFAIFAAIVARMGDASAAASQAMLQLLALSFMQAVAISTRLLDSGRALHRRAAISTPPSAATARALSLGLVVTAFFAVLFLSVPGLLLRVFNERARVPRARPAAARAGRVLPGRRRHGHHRQRRAARRGRHALAVRGPVDAGVDAAARARSGPSRSGCRAACSARGWASSSTCSRSAWRGCSASAPATGGRSASNSPRARTIGRGCPTRASPWLSIRRSSSWLQRRIRARCARRTRTRCPRRRTSPASACSSSPTAWAGRTAARPPRKLCVDTLGRAFRDPHGKPEARLRRGLELANEEVYSHALSQPRQEGHGHDGGRAPVRARAGPDLARVDRRQPLLPAARRRARGALARSLDRGRVARDGRAQRRGGREPPAPPRADSRDRPGAGRVGRDRRRRRAAGRPLPALLRRPPRLGAGEDAQARARGASARGVRAPPRRTRERGGRTGQHRDRGDRRARRCPGRRRSARARGAAGVRASVAASARATRARAGARGGAARRRHVHRVDLALERGDRRGHR